jgi:TonB family protein
MGVKSLRQSISFSVVFHALILTAWLLLLGKQATQPPPKVTWIELEPPSKQDRQRIVQTAPGDHVKDPTADSFLGKQNQTVDRQTVSRDKNVTMGKAQARPKAPSESETEKKKRTVAPEISKLGVAMIPNFKETPKDEPQWADQGSEAKDYVKGVKESERTALNTREYVFYGYYQRIRGRLERAWIPILREKLIRFHRAGRHLASDKEHVTSLKVILNSKGEIIRVKMLDESGSQELDDAAVRAFNNAGPFPNPPQGMLDFRGEIEIPWQFVLRT